jgi:hypothetical protein
MSLTKTIHRNVAKWILKDTAGTYAMVTLTDGEVNTHLHRVHLDEEEGRELFTALQEAFIEQEQPQ